MQSEYFTLTQANVNAYRIGEIIFIKIHDCTIRKSSSNIPIVTLPENMIAAIAVEGAVHNLEKSINYLPRASVEGNVIKLYTDGSTLIPQGGVYTFWFSFPII